MNSSLNEAHAMNDTRIRRGWSLALTLVLLLAVAACDTTGGEDSIILSQGPTDEVELQFEFVPADRSTNSPFTVIAEPALTDDQLLGAQIATYLDEEGAGAVPADLLNAELTRAELIIAQPPEELWDFTDSVILQLRAGGDVTDIAQSTNPPDNREVELDVLPRDLASILSRDNPELLLRVEPNSLMQDEPVYTIRVQLRFRFEVPL